MSDLQRADAPKHEAFAASTEKSQVTAAQTENLVLKTTGCPKSQSTLGQPVCFVIR